MDLGAQEEDKKMRYVPKDGDEYCFIETDGAINERKIDYEKNNLDNGHCRQHDHHMHGGGARQDGDTAEGGRIYRL